MAPRRVCAFAAPIRSCFEESFSVSNSRDMTSLQRVIVAATLAWGVSVGHAQIDPSKRELIQLGYNLPLEGNGPLSAYAFYYLNLPRFVRTNLTLRLAVAPVYLDSELGISQLLGPQTDFGIGIAGGGFADTYSEVRRGRYIQAESFTGHGAGASASIYHLFNPGDRIPLNGVFRLESHSSFYERDGKTAPNFQLPDDRTSFNLRTGLRWGGREPLMLSAFAMEISGWYEAELRSKPGPYGFPSASDPSERDRRVQQLAHLFWARALLAYTFEKWKHNLSASLTLGTSIDSDRFSAYRLGGVLPLAAEFPLTLPGYIFQEISAKDFALLGINYSLPLDRADRWAINALVTTAGVNYISGLEQPGNWHSGVGGGIRFRSKSDAWQVVLGYAYGVDAIRKGGRGAHSVGILVQFDLERANVSLFEPGENPIRSRGLQHILGNFF